MPIAYVFKIGVKLIQLNIMDSFKEKQYKAISLIRYKLHYLMRKTLGFLRNEKPITAIVATAPKVGSTWLVKLLRDLYMFNHAVLPDEVRPATGQGKLIDLRADATEDFLNALSENYIIKSHSHPPHWTPQDNIKFISIFRDPRDVVISLIFFLANISTDVGGWPELNEMDSKERIKHYLNKDIGVIEKLELWWSYPHVHKLHYEDLLANPKEEMRKIVNYLGLKISDKRIEQAIDNNRFEKHSGGREAGKENKGSFFRKGIAGDWVNYFDEETVEMMKTVHDGRWNKLIVTLGYEASEDWTMPKKVEA